jgi:hypothetical protein
MQAEYPPLLRSSVGFDRVDRLLETVSRMDETNITYPPYQHRQRQAKTTIELRWPWPVSMTEH